MNIGAAFPSKYLKASEIPDGQFVPVTIDSVQIENLAMSSEPDEDKPVIYFVGKTKGMVLNKTNANTLMGAFGPETDDWNGKRVLLYSTETTFQGKSMPCLRIKIDRSAAASPAANNNGGGYPRNQQQVRQQPERQTVQSSAAVPADGEIDPDDIPF